MTSAVWIVLAFLGLVLLVYAVKTVGDRMAHGRPSGRRADPQDLRAEDALSGRRDASNPAAASDTILDRKRWDASGPAGL